MKNTLEIFPQRFRTRTPSTSHSLAEFEDEMSQWFTPRSLRTELSGFDFSPSCDIVEHDKDYVIRFDIPGVKKDEINIEIDHNRITVSGERRVEKEEKHKKHFLSESYHGSFMRSLTLPTTVVEDNVYAKYHDGVLTITVPKTETTKSKRIKIQ